MKKRVCAWALVLSLFLSGCSWLDGSYVSVTPHRAQKTNPQSSAASASNYRELIAALEQVVSAGRESAAILVPDYPMEDLKASVDTAMRYIRDSYSIGDYAVEDIRYELGTSASAAVAVTVTYSRSLTEIQQIRQVRDMEAAKMLAAQSLRNFDAGIVLLVEKYENVDMTQYLQDYAWEHPQSVMEVPQITEAAYGRGDSRVLELIFTYQNSRDDLRAMQSQVEPVFNAARLYVSGDGADRQKFSQLYGFLMERFDYKFETSLTPSYSLLRHGVGDSRAFAAVYAAMCRGAGLECLTVTGTCSGEPRTWNIIREGERYYHVDLLRSSAAGSYQTFTDDQMEGYVWDYSAYPVCGWNAPVQGETAPSEATEAAE